MFQGKLVLMGHYPRPSHRNNDSSVIKIPTRITFEARLTSDINRRNNINPKTIKLDAAERVMRILGMLLEFRDYGNLVKGAWAR